MKKSTTRNAVLIFTLPGSDCTAGASVSTSLAGWSRRTAFDGGQFAGRHPHRTQNRIVQDQSVEFQADGGGLENGLIAELNLVGRRRRVRLAQRDREHFLLG